MHENELILYNKNEKRMGDTNSGSLGMAHVKDLLLASGLCNEVYHCWKIFLGHFIMTVPHKHNRKNKQQKEKYKI